MDERQTDRSTWTLALALILCLGLALILTSLVQAQDAAHSASGATIVELQETDGWRSTRSAPEAVRAPKVVLPEEDTPAPQAVAALPGATGDWWTAVQARISDLSMADSPDWTAFGNSDNDFFGYSVASAGDVNGDGYADAIVGAYMAEPRGAAYVYHGSAAGLATTPAVTLTGESAGEWFGTSVAGAGDVNGDGYADAIVADSWYGPFQGAAYVYHGSASGLADTPVLTLTRDFAGAHFGNSVASAGDVNGDGYTDIIVGAYEYGDDEEGAAFVYLGSAAGLAATPALTLTGKHHNDIFGYSVAGAGDVNGDGYADAIVGTYGVDPWGAAYIYLGSTAGLADTPAVTFTGEIADEWFGYSVAGAGDVNGDGYADAIVGARSPSMIGAHAYPTGLGYGAAYLYYGSASGLAATPVLTLTSETRNDEFGRSVASAGDVNGDGYADVIVGASHYDTSHGAAYIYHGSASGLAATPALTLTGENDGDQFGASVASAGDVNGDGYADVIAGARDYGNSQGAAYGYHGSAAGLATTPGPTLSGEHDGDRFGSSVATAGDVNGDGYADAIVGAWGFGTNQGAAYLYPGSAAGLSSTGDPTLIGENDGDQFGASVASAGDVNGDGYADAIVGAWGYGTNQGAAYLYPGSATGLAATPALTLTGEHDNDLFGYSVASAGDVNGDGYADVIVGAHRYPGGDEQGAAYVYCGSDAGLASTPALTLTGEEDGDHFGYSVASAGDVNGDGYADVIVGAYGYSSEGAAFVYFGSAEELATEPDLTLDGENTGDQFGIAVAGAGDVNGDGYADVIVGAYSYGTNQGAAYLYFGSDAGPVEPAARRLEGEAASDYFGKSVAGAGDVNGDGYADVIVGAHRYGSDQGAAYVYHGSPTGLAATPALTLPGEFNGDNFGASVAGAGDVNGDGYADAIVGAYGFGNPFWRGRAYVYHGNDGAGRTVLARQARGDGSAMPVQSWGLSHAWDRVQVLLRATDPRGRGRVKLQVQACPPGTAFGDAACTTHTTSDWTDVTATPGGVTLPALINSLSGDTLYRWRARVLYAHFTVDQPGITPPPNPAHGPWRRWLGQAIEADVRTSTPSPDLVVVKAVTPATAAPGETLTYTYRLTNSGDVTLSSIVAVDDKLGTVPLGASTLAPDAWTTGVLVYTVGEADLPGPLINTVVVTGSPPVGADVSTTDSATVTLTETPTETEYRVRLPVVLKNFQP